MKTSQIDEHVSIVRHDADPARVAVMLPGRGYTVDHPLLYFSTEVLRCAGWSVVHVRWSPPGDPPDDAAASAWVEARAREVLALDSGSTQIIVGKSLGTRAAPVALELGLAGIWLTPILNTSVVAALTAMTQRCLLVGGTADALWSPTTARSTWKDVLELPDADHSLLVDGDPVASLDVLRTVTVATGQFVRSLPMGSGASRHE